MSNLLEKNYESCFHKGLEHDPQTYHVNREHFEKAITYLKAGKEIPKDVYSYSGHRKWVDPYVNNAEQELPTYHAHIPSDSRMFNTDIMVNQYINLMRIAYHRDENFEDMLQSVKCDIIKNSFTDTIEGIVDETGNIPVLASQFLLKHYMEGNREIEQKFYTFEGANYLTAKNEFIRVQGGHRPSTQNKLAKIKRYITTLADLGAYVHKDKDAAYKGTMFILNENGTRRYPYALMPEGEHNFVHEGLPTDCNLLTFLGYAGLKASWKNKYTSMIGRPESFGGVLEFTPEYFGVHARTLSKNEFIKHFKKKNKTSLLPMMYPEGSPVHPSASQGHAGYAISTVFGLKYLFDCNDTIKNPVKPSKDGMELVPYEGELTVQGELNKLAWNIFIGRDIAGVHWHTDWYDYVKSLESYSAECIRYFNKVRGFRTTEKRAIKGLFGDIYEI